MARLAEIADDAATEDDSGGMHPVGQAGSATTAGRTRPGTPQSAAILLLARILHPGQCGHLLLSRSFPPSGVGLALAIPFAAAVVYQARRSVRLQWILRSFLR